MRGFPESIDLAHFDREGMRAALTRVFHERLTQLSTSEVKAFTSSQPSIDLLIIETVKPFAGRWFCGLDYARPEDGWCSCHQLFGKATRVDESTIAVAVESALSAVDKTRSYFTRLREEADRISAAWKEALAAGNQDAFLSSAFVTMIQLTADLTDCSSSWYYQAGENLGFLGAELLGRQSSPELESKFADELSNIAEARFSSWCGPDDATTKAAGEEARRLFQDYFKGR